MTIFQFVASLVASLAWPVTLVFLVFLFRRPILALLDKMRQFEGWGLKASFGDRLEGLAEKTARVGQLPPPEAKATPRDARAEKPPSAAQPGTPIAPSAKPRSVRNIFYGGGSATHAIDIILEGWGAIERAIVRASGAKSGGFVWDELLVASLLEKGKLRPETYALIEEARQLRNAVAHRREREPDLTEAVVYRETAQAIARSILRDAGVHE